MADRAFGVPEDSVIISRIGDVYWVRDYRALLAHDGRVLVQFVQPD
jgi:hypothetical protein